MRASGRPDSWTFSCLISPSKVCAMPLTCRHALNVLPTRVRHALNVLPPHHVLGMLVSAYATWRLLDYALYETSSCPCRPCLKVSYHMLHCTPMQ